MSKISVAAGGLLANILCIAGAFIGIPFVLITFGGFALIGFKAMFPSFFAFLAIDIVCAALVVTGVRMRQRTRRFKTYVYLISHKRKSRLQDLAKETGRGLAFVTQDLKWMIKRNYFADAYIDESLQEIVMARKLGNVSLEDITAETVICQSCGAKVTKQKNVLSRCEYCNSPVA